MKTSTLTLYGNKNGLLFPLKYERNFAVDNFNGFISRYYLKSFTFQYIKHALDVSIKIVEGEEYQAPISDIDLYKYASIQNEDESPVYYYITKAEVVSSSCIRLSLRMDTLNSLLEVESPRRLLFDKKTKVTREHEDRFYTTPLSSGEYVRRIPLLSEGITPQLYKEREELLNLEDGNFGAWYLIYKTDNITATEGTPNPVRAYLLNDEPITIRGASPTSEVTISVDTLINRRRGYNTLAFTRLEGNSGTITTHRTGFPVKTFSLSDYDAIILLKNPSSAEFTLYALNDGTTRDSELLGTTGYITFTGVWTYGGFMNNSLKPSSNNFVINNAYELHYYIEASDNKLDVNIYTSLSTIPFSALDRTDSRLVKVVTLPYCPIKYSMVNGVFTPTESITLKSGMIALNSRFEAFKVDLGKITQYNALRGSTRSLVPQIGEERYILDSKLYHSDYYINKFVYDSFSYTIKLEQVLANYNREAVDFTKLYLDYVVSSEISGKFYFNLKTPLSSLDSQDYDFIIYVNRNNDMALYDSQFINYLRTGYNFDVKAKNRQEVTSWITTALSVGGTIAGIATGNVALTAVSITSTLTSITNAISSTIQAENTLNNKLAQLDAQKASVLNADDVSLLKEYSGNKLKYEMYRASEVVRKLLDDLFYYTGYLSNSYKVPTHDSRVYFDFLACEPVFVDTFNYSNEVIEEVTAKLREGATFFHEVGGEYDFAQELENWELSII